MKKKEEITVIEQPVPEGPTPEQLREERLRRKRRARRRTAGRIIDRFFGVILVTVIMFGLAGLGLEYVLIEGPSPALKETFVMTMLETRRFTFIPNIFLTEDEVQEIASENRLRIEGEQDMSLINLPAKTEEPIVDETGADAYSLVDEDGDGIVYQDISGQGFVGYMITILDPSRVFVGMPNGYGGYGLTLEELCQKYDALGGINGGGYDDPSGAGTGGIPQGLTIIDGVCYNEGDEYNSFAGFDADGILHVGYFSYADALDMNIVNGVSFGPILIYNGEAVDPGALESGVNPRTAIAQRGDGAVIMLVIDGRQVHSVGARYSDVVNILLDHGAVNACNMDGGSSTTMYYNGAYVNKCSSANGLARPLPNGFLFK